AIGSAVLVLSTAASPQGTGTPPTADRPGARDDIEVLAPRDLTIDARHAGSTTSKLRIPIRTRPADRLERLAFQTIGVSLGGRPLEPSAVQLAVERAAPQPWLVVTIDLAMAAESGTYTVKALASSPDLQDPPPVLELTFTRPAAELRVANSLRVERVVYLPGLSVTRPDSVIFSETKGKSAVLPEPSTWISDLVRDGQLVPGRMEVKLPTSIDAGAQGAATLAIRGDVPLGKSTGSVTVRAPQLAAGVYEASVDVVGRVSRIWLVAAVVGGIGLGYYTRTSLEDRRKRLQARIAASERLNRIDDQIGREIDDDVIGELTRVRAGLLTALRSGDPAPEAIDIATKAADDGLTNALRKADERRAALRAGIADLSAQLGSPENLPDPIRPIVEHALAGLKAAGARLNAGVIAPVEEELADLRRTLPDRLRAALTDWKGSIDLALNRMGDWPETLFARASAELASRWKDPNGLKLETLKDYLEMAATQGLGIRSSLLDVGLASILDL
ncbi:MAG TPA: hypothetical protein VF590_24195, partial [Isosphaeraceae bacterium]